MYYKLLCKEQLLWQNKSSSISNERGVIVRRVSDRSGGSNAGDQPKQNNTDQTAIAVPFAPVVMPPILLPDLQASGGGLDGKIVPADPANIGVKAVPANAAQQPDQAPAEQMTAADPQNTAFTMRMQAANTANAVELQEEMSGISAAGIKKISDADEPAGSQLPGEMASRQTVSAAFEQNSQLDFGSEIRQAAAPSQAAELQPRHTAELPKAPEPLNNIVLQVGQSAGEKVQVRLVQQSGELRLAVRTDDSELAHGLQQGLSDLVGKLQDGGYRTEAWKPVQSPVAAAATAETQNSSNQSHQGDSQSQPGSQQQDGGQRQQNQSNRPRWVEELESSLTSAAPALGESHGLGN